MIETHQMQFMKTFLVSALLVFATGLSAQFNVDLLSNLDYDERLSDVWGYAADDREYALVGLANGISIVDITDPTFPIELEYIPAKNTRWRDFKTWDGFAYATNDGASTDGVFVIDLRMLPDSISYTNWNPEIDSTVLTACHNIFIDEFGYAYLAGCNVNNGGVIFLDVFSTPGSPSVVGLGDPRYSHDVYARDHIMYSSDIYEGYFSITDVSDKSNPKLLATQGTPSNFTHNTWLSDDSSVLFTTDERGNAPVASYDISDIDNITQLDAYRPLHSIGEGVVPHNVHVLNDFLVISYYTDGVRVVDANRPDWLIEVGNYDTWPDAQGATNGNWGAYPFLPSGVVLATDKEYGLFVLDVDYKRASYLEIFVKDAGSGNVIENAAIEVVDTDITGDSDAFGRLKTGGPYEGNFTVEVDAPGYDRGFAQIFLTAGEVTSDTIELNATSTFTLFAQVTERGSGTPIPFADIAFESETGLHRYTSDDQGSLQIDQFVSGTFDVYVGSWGFNELQVLEAELNPGNDALEIELESGYEDGFYFDYGWEANVPTTGGWEVDLPIGLYPDPTISWVPTDDADGDIGKTCFITENIDVLNPPNGVFGVAELTSPVINIAQLEDPHLHYEAFILGMSGAGDPSADSLEAYLVEGTTETLVHKLGTTFVGANINDWRSVSVRLKDYSDLEGDFRLRFRISNMDPDALVECMLDHVRIVDSLTTSSNPVTHESSELNVFPNPFGASLQLEFGPLEQTDSDIQISVYNALGKLIYKEYAMQSVKLSVPTADWQPGVYFLQTSNGESFSESIRIVKQ